MKGIKIDMNTFSLVSIITLFALLLSGATGLAAENGKNLPVIQGKRVVATVSGDPITLEEYNRELGSLGTTGAGKKQDLLKRLINARLIVQEGKRAGIDALPEIKQSVEAFSRVTLREELMERHVKNIKPDEKEVEKRYKESVKEWKMSSLLFEKEDVAKEIERSIKEGKNFEEAIKDSVSNGKAKGSEEGKFFKERQLLPEILAVIKKMKLGEISSVIRVKPGYVLLRLEGLRYPVDDEARERTRRSVLLQLQKEALIKYDKALKEKYTKVNQGLLKSLDLESKDPGFERLLEDRRVVAEIKGEAPITVGELTDYIRQQLYHGVERAVETKRVNAKKNQSLDTMLHKRVFRKEALREGIDKTESYKNKVKEHEHSLVFGAFVQKAVAPEVKLQEKELEEYYSGHIKDYTSPEMMRLNRLVFKSRINAEEAIEKLKKGTEFKWLRSHAEGQLGRNAEGVLDFEGKLLIVEDLPKDLQKVIKGARTGDSKLYESPKGHFYVLAVEEIVPSKPKPYQEVREKIAKEVYNEKLKKAVEDLADKLRAMSDVKIYLKEN